MIGKRRLIKLPYIKGEEALVYDIKPEEQMNEYDISTFHFLILFAILIRYTKLSKIMKHTHIEHNQIDELD